MVAPRLLSPDGSVQDSVRSFKTVQTLLARRTPYGSTRRGRAVLAAHLGGTAETDPTAGAVPVDWALGAALYVRRKAIDAVGPRTGGRRGGQEGVCKDISRVSTYT